MKKLNDNLYRVDVPGELKSIIDNYRAENHETHSSFTVYDEDLEPTVYPYVVYMEVRPIRNDMVLTYIPKSAFDN